MRPLRSATDEPVNWLNYKTGIKYLYFRMDADDKQASIAIELRHPELSVRRDYFEKLRELEKLLHQTTGEAWQWELQVMDEDDRQVSRISKQLKAVNIFDVNDWPAIISFLKPRMLALDAFWAIVKQRF